MLEALVTELSRDATVVLRAPEAHPFDGRDVWDVMLCLGLRWGDMDLFHWWDEKVDDSHFCVWTSTSPGYFLPELIAEGKVQTGDLVFGFSIPRAAQPLGIFEVMVKCADYAQRRLGGAILNAEGRPFDAEREREKIRESVDRLRAAGFEPGVSPTLRLF